MHHRTGSGAHLCTTPFLFASGVDRGITRLTLRKPCLAPHTQAAAPGYDAIDADQDGMSYPPPNSLARSTFWLVSFVVVVVSFVTSRTHHELAVHIGTSPSGERPGFVIQ